jgi:hypothetical protein
MDLKLKVANHVLIAEVSGHLTLREALKVCILACDGAGKRGSSTFLMDASAVDGELSIFERYQLGKTVADYCVSHGWSYKVALLGTEPAVNGFGALVASNRGLVATHFRDRKKALEWLDALARSRSRLQGKQES